MGTPAIKHLTSNTGAAYTWGSIKVEDLLLDLESAQKDQNGFYR